MPLTDLDLLPVYSHSNCPDLIADFYEKLLYRAVRYDRATYTFSAKALIAAAAGTAGLIHNRGNIRLICDHRESADVLQAIHDDRLDPETALCQSVDPEALLRVDTDDIASRDHHELACWLVANGIMQIKVAIRGDDDLFHPKYGIVEDAHSNRVAFSGSLNETLAGWRNNWESFNVFTDAASPDHLQATANQFEALWNNRASGLRVIDLPAYFREYIVKHAPPPPSRPRLVREPRRKYGDYWQDIYDDLARDPDSTAATIPVTLWPHQERFRRQNVGSDRIRRLIADEVGLGKTLQAGVILKTRLNQRKAGRALIIAPKAATRQWRDELLMKFAIDAPIIETRGRLYRARPDDRNDRNVGDDRNDRVEPPLNPPWSAPLAIAGHQWLVRHADRFLETCGEYDLIIVDEAHRARFLDVDHSHRQPNQYLRLLTALAPRARDLLLLTATPMQLHEAELWALLKLLEPEGWSAEEYQRFYRSQNADQPPDLADWKYRRDLWRRSLAADADDDYDYLLDSDNDDYIAGQLQDPAALQSSLDAMQRNAPGKRLMSRHTRALLRQYRDQGLLDAPVPQRRARDVTIAMTPQERALYDDIQPLIAQCYGDRISPQALGFVATIFRKRMGSSTYAYAQTLRNAANRSQPDDDDDLLTLLDDADLDELAQAEALNKAANRHALRRAADVADELSHTDSKRARLVPEIAALRAQGHTHILIFTQFRDTQTWLSEHLRLAGRHVTELYGQDAELGDRGERLAAFRQQPEGILLCTETASESLNLQFCSAVLNYDIPWNPMTLEQRAGRIDRIGQQRPVVDVVNLFYDDTAEHDAYHAVARRFKDICDNVGEYPPIIAAGIQRIIREKTDPEAALDRLQETARNEFDINRLNADWDTPIQTIQPKVGIADLEKPLRQPALMPPGWKVQPSGGKHWQITNPAGHAYRVTTDPLAYQEADGRLRWWSGPRDLQP